jgi:hypothetical protein
MAPLRRACLYWWTSKTVRLKRTLPLVIAALALTAGVSAAKFVGPVYWQPNVIFQKASGQIREFGWPDLLSMIKVHA